ncbi:MAG: DUF167 domain-containing protein [Deltaproteobacteria bacterium]|nr:DUF167 domain-containing protein [Candidatus Anaeroferrophillus wilburensis]MBN2889651.1 DUF167 domain-containing protein [Deltaproteobacteria bacterium]
MALWCQERKGKLLFRVLVQPRASANRVVGLHGDVVKVSLTAPPVDGAANKLCREFLARILGIAKSKVELVSGETARLKTFAVEGLSVDELQERLGVS